MGLENFGIRLSNIRKELGYTQEELALRLGALHRNLYSQSGFLTASFLQRHLLEYLLIPDALRFSYLLL